MAIPNNNQNSVWYPGKFAGELLALVTQNHQKLQDLENSNTSSEEAQLIAHCEMQNLASVAQVLEVVTNAPSEKEINAGAKLLEVKAKLEKSVEKTCEDAKKAGANHGFVAQVQEIMMKLIIAIVKLCDSFMKTMTNVFSKKEEFKQRPLTEVDNYKENVETAKKYTTQYKQQNFKPTKSAEEYKQEYDNEVKRSPK